MNPSPWLAPTVAAFLAALVPPARGQEPPDNSHHHHPASATPSPEATSPTPDEDDRLRLADLEQRAMATHPSISMAAAAIDAAAARRSQAGRWPNPEIGLVAEEVALDGNGDRGKVGGVLSQRFVLGGKLARSREVADAEVELARMQAEATRLALLTRVRLAFYRALAAQRSLELRIRLEALAAEATEVTGHLFNTGAADEPDRLAARIETEQATLARGAAERELEAARQQLASAVGAEELEPRQLEDLFKASLPKLDRETIQREVLDQSPSLAIARAALLHAQAKRGRERRQPIPDLELEVGTLDDREPSAPGAPRVGSEAFGGARIAIPLFDRNRGNIAAATAELDSAGYELERARLELLARCAVAYSRYARAEQAVHSYRDVILPAAQRSYALYAASYQQMTAAYPQVLIAQRTLFQAETEYLKELAELWSAAAVIEGRLVEGAP